MSKKDQKSKAMDQKEQKKKTLKALRFFEIISDYPKRFILWLLGYIFIILELLDLDRVELLHVFNLFYWIIALIIFSLMISVYSRYLIKSDKNYIKQNIGKPSAAVSKVFSGISIAVFIIGIFLMISITQYFVRIYRLGDEVINEFNVMESKIKKLQDENRNPLSLQQINTELIPKENYIIRKVGDQYVLYYTNTLKSWIFKDRDIQFDSLNMEKSSYEMMYRKEKRQFFHLGEFE